MKEAEEQKERPVIIAAFDRIAKTTNGAGRASRLGGSGKYYCGGRLETKCSCCDGYCGPDNGCNCLSCMKLDIASRQLQKGYLVNKEGRIARPSPSTQQFYCGSRVLVGKPGCDGYCGPTNGPACGACILL
jgi:hypothetical protein